MTKGKRSAVCQKQQSNLLLAMMVAATIVLVSCGSELPSAPTAAQPTSEPPAPIATAVAQAESMVIAAHDESGTPYCGRLCQPAFWLNADVSTLEAELARGASVEANDGHGFTPLHHAASFANLYVLEALLDRGAEINAIADWDLTPLHVATHGGLGIYRVGMGALPSAMSKILP